jgi:hypothetical protein
MILSATRVEQIFHHCLFEDNEDTSSAIVANGITCNVGFNPVRLNEHKREIREMLLELPNEFKKSGGGGWSFLQACMNNHGQQWTGLHQRMEQLFQLGLATGIVQEQLPRDVWDILPGGMPYYVVNDI